METHSAGARAVLRAGSRVGGKDFGGAVESKEGVGGDCVSPNMP